MPRARSALAAGRGAILDGTFQRRVDRDAARAIAAAAGVPILFVECGADDDEMRRRLAARTRRGDDPSDADWSVYLQQRARYEAFGRRRDRPPQRARQQRLPAHEARLRASVAREGV